MFDDFWLPRSAVARLEGGDAGVVDASETVELGLDEAGEGDAFGTHREGEHWFDHLDLGVGLG